MVKAGDIGKDARKFVKDDFFTGNEIKINQTGCGKTPPPSSSVTT